MQISIAHNLHMKLAKGEAKINFQRRGLFFFTLLIQLHFTDAVREAIADWHKVSLILTKYLSFTFQSQRSYLPRKSHFKL